jgi:predicted permease
MLTDFRTSIRLLRQAPGLAFTVVITLAVTIGANAAVFSVIDKVLVQASPVDQPDQIVVIWSRERAAAGTIGEISYTTFRRWQTDAHGFQNLAALGSTTWSLILREGDPATIPIAAVSASFFPLMGVVPSMGRTLLPEDDQQGSARVAVMSHGSWVRRFAADPNIVGRSLRFQDAVYTIVGVMPDGFDYPRGAELWLPLVPQLVDAGRQWNTDLLTDPGVGMLFVLGRLDSHMTLDAARNDVSALIAQNTMTTFRPGSEAVLTPLDEHVFGNIRPALFALAVCVGLVLLIGCANVSVLFLVRSTTRAHETAIRLAIGATRWSIVRQSLSDSLVLTILGGAVGLGLAYWTVKILVALAPADVPRLDSVRFDARTLAFTWTVCLMTATLVGLATGLQAARRELSSIINSGGSRLVRSHHLRRAFVVTQVALALALLVCAGLVGRSFVNLLRIDVGFNPSHVLTLDVTLPDAPPDRHNLFYGELLDRVRAMPGVEAAGAVFLRPLEYSGIGQDSPVLIEGQRTDLKSRDWEQNPLVNLESATPEYFRAIGIPIVRGRSFAETDTARAPRAAIVSENLARRLWPGQDAIGKRLLPPGMSPDEQGRPPWATVVGVARNARYRGLTDPRFDLYLPHLQIPGVLVKHLMVRTSGDPLALAAPIRIEAHRLESSALVERITAMEDIVAQATAPWRFSTRTLGLLSLLAMALASMGLYAVVSQTVVERTREIGVRVAIGALPREIVQLVLRDSVALTLAGIGIGLIVALGVGRILAGLLFDVQLIDPSTLAAVAALFIAVSTVAIVVPAWRGAHVDPVVALRHE